MLVSSVGERCLLSWDAVTARVRHYISQKDYRVKRGAHLLSCDKTLDRRLARSRQLSLKRASTYSCLHKVCPKRWECQIDAKNANDAKKCKQREKSREHFTNAVWSHKRPRFGVYVARQRSLSASKLCVWIPEAQADAQVQSACHVIDNSASATPRTAPS